ncbi:MAG: tetratricopeptide repeat protein [SAR324 cluster bacterium]|nr:tetratricopeptide repeat protein [SAR324 cluster bacterium]
MSNQKKKNNLVLFFIIALHLPLLIIIIGVFSGKSHKENKTHIKETQLSKKATVEEILQKSQNLLALNNESKRGEAIQRLLPIIDDSDAAIALISEAYLSSKSQIDLKKGEKFLLLSAKRGNLNSQKQLGLRLANAEMISSTGPNHSKALYWFIRAARQNDPDAQFLAGFMYTTGTGVDSNQEKGKYWLKKAASQKNKNALALLTLMYINKSQFSDAEKTMAFNYHENSDLIFIGLDLEFSMMSIPKEFGSLLSELGNNKQPAEQKTFLGIAYYDMQKYLKAKYWLKSAASDDEHLAQLILGYMNLKGLGGNENLKAAAYWLWKSAKGGNGQAMHLLGILRLHGRGIAPNIENASQLIISGWSRQAVGKFSYEQINCNLKLDCN